MIKLTKNGKARLAVGITAGVALLGLNGTAGAQAPVETEMTTNAEVEAQQYDQGAPVGAEADTEADVNAEATAEEQYGGDTEASANAEVEA